MIHKLFPLDKNHILKQAQINLEDCLLKVMVEELRKSYTFLFNPLGLRDDTYIQIIERCDFPLEGMQVIYRQLSGIYRYKYGCNQLEILFDGRSHLEKYKDDWSKQFLVWIRDLGNQESYVKSMLRLTLLYDGKNRANFAENRCKSFINEYFEVKVIKRNGELKIAV